MSHHAIQVRRVGNGANPALSPAADSAVPTPFADLPGVSEWYRWRSNQIHYRKAGAGPPVVLLHMVDAGSSCIEWRKNIGGLSESFTVFAVDLPGFGQSGIPDAALRTDLYLQFIREFLGFVARSEGAVPRVVGSGTGASYAASIAASQPALVDRLMLVAPTGISAVRPNPLGAIAFHALGLPILSSIHTTACSRSAILEHLQNDVYGDDLRAGMNEADARYWVAHRPGADRVERARLAALLNVNLRPLIPAVKVPVVLAWGRRAKCPPVDDAEVWKELNPETRLKVFDQSGLCPHTEEPGRFNELAMDFMSRDFGAMLTAA